MDCPKRLLGLLVFPALADESMFLGESMVAEATKPLSLLILSPSSQLQASSSKPSLMAQRPLSKRLWYIFVQRVFQLLGVVGYGVRHSGRENIPSEGGVLVVSNHQSHFDPPLAGTGVRRRMNYLARKTLFAIGPFGWFIHSLDAIPIDREGIGLGGIKESLRRLKRGEMVLIFPEGTRTRDGEIATFRPGFTTLAVRSKAAILPMAIEGAYDVWPRQHKFRAWARFASIMARSSRRKWLANSPSGNC